MLGNKAKRARKEIKVVSNIAEDYNQKIIRCESDINNYLTKLKELNSSYDELEDKLDVTSDEIEKRRIYGEQDRINMAIDELQSYVDNTEIEVNDFRHVARRLSQLLMYCQTFYHKEQYKFIIKSIPEKKLPQMVKSTEKMREIDELVKELLRIFREEADRRNYDAEETNKEIDRMINESNELSSLTRNRLAEMRERKRAEHIRKRVEESTDVNDQKKEHETRKTNLS